MRLTHLKLAGFKSFVDPTTLHIHGQRVGVVGPNGCGKSNVMESVRWVLGESSAKEMRGDSMDAVIFNGSANRKAIGRASVELVFDNSLGSVGGPWAQYAEISVKRVIERDKGSTYYINNTTVRRRDVSDLFLGTGLGRNSYAIIGQNTISRIVEAKPEELRVFLEEAAGISKYKERRRETELRLRDTRENLRRVEDIRQEIDNQITRLQAQAVVTQQYHALQESLKMAQGRLWWINKRDAGVQWEKSQRQVEKVANDLEAQTSILRKTETELETLRQQHFEQSESVQQAQAAYYESNALLANLETQIKHNQEAKERLIAQQQQAEQQVQRLQSLLEELNQDLQQAQQNSLLASDELGIAEKQVEQQQTKLPELKSALEQCQKAYQQAQQQRQEAESALQLEQLSLSHLISQDNQIQLRQEQLQQDLSQISLPDPASIEALQQQQIAYAQEVDRLTQQIVMLKQQEASLQEDIREARIVLTEHDKQLMQHLAQIGSLENILKQLGSAQQMSSWLSSKKLDDKPRVWQALEITPGWELAVEAALSRHLNAVTAKQMDASLLTERPPSSLSYLQYDIRPAAQKSHPYLKPLLDKVKVLKPELQGLISELLSDMYISEDNLKFLDIRDQLEPHQLLINQQGDVLARYGVILNAAAGDNQGVLERQAELKALKAKSPDLEAHAKRQQAKLEQLEQKLMQLGQQLQQSNQSLNQVVQSKHALDIELQKLVQTQQHVQQREASIYTELTQLSEKLSSHAQEIKQKQQTIAQLERHIPTLVQLAESAAQTWQESQKAYQEFTQILLQEEKHLQEKQFNKKINTNKIIDIENRIKQGDEEKARLLRQLDEIVTMLNAAKMEGLQQSLQTAVIDKQEKEKKLVEVRDAMAQFEQTLQDRERFRIQIEQLIHPMRDKLEQARLLEQEMRLNFERCQNRLSELDIEESLLLQEMPSNARAQQWEEQTQQIQLQIDALGAVNLAAIQELESEVQRKQYLDSQASDLEQAISTLEDAIVKIDRETRSRLQSTYDETNRHFGDLFKDLFGGGQAKLELLGAEILDSGVQVFAQPPGKKNSTIHLLSGGEKALTALALVFALFKLNPAPFCLMDEVDAPLDDSNTVRFCEMVKKMSERTQFLFVSHNKITMEMAQQLIGVTMQESGVSRVVEVDMYAAMKMQEPVLAELN